MSRSLRNGREYDTAREYVPKTRKRKNTGATKKDNGEQAVVKMTNRLTFGSITPSEQVLDVPLIALGAGKRRGIALNANAGVKLSPVLYLSVYNRTPPIKATSRLITAPEQEPDASNGEAGSPGVEAADCALGSVPNVDPGAADRAPASSNEPTTPIGKTTGDVTNGSPDDEEGLFTTARTSRVRDEVYPSGDNSNVSNAQYVVKGTSTNSPVRKSRKRRRKTRNRSLAVSEPSPSTARSAMQPTSWAEEVRRAEGSTERASSLPDLDPEWINPDWSRALYTSAPASTNDNAESDADGVEVNAMIYKVSEDYVFSDDQYAEVLRNLRAETSETTNQPSQTSGAGPSSQRTRHRVTVEEIEDEESPGWVTPPLVSDSETDTPVGKGKGRAHGKRKKRSERPNLGVELDNLKRVDKARVARRRSSGRFDAGRVDQTPQGFRSGGYLELMHGEEARRNRAAKKSAAADNRDTRSRASSRTTSRVEHDRVENRAHITREEPPQRGDPLGDASDDEDVSDETYEDEEGPNDPSHNSESESDDDSSSSSSDDDDGDMRKLKRKLKKERAKNKKLVRRFTAQARSGYKAQAPKSYDGDADIDRFELFAFNFDNWCMETKLSQRMRVRNVGRFLEGKASIWYMSNVAPNLKRHDMESIYHGLFNYCFPPDFREEMRRKYMSKRQGEQSVQDYFAELERLGRRLKVTAEQHVQRAWDGAARYIKGEWAIKGILPENTDIDELRETAIDIERAHKIRKSIDQYDDRKRGKRDRSRSPDRKRERKKDKHFKRMRSRDGDKTENKSSKGSKRDRERSENWRRNKRDGGNPKSAKSDRQKDEYRAANKCFECAEVGHLAKDCPTKNRAKPSGLRTNAASLKSEAKVRTSSLILQELQKMTEAKEAIEVSAVRVDVGSATVAGKGKRVKPGQQHIERNAVRVKDLARRVPNTIIVQAELEGESIRVLLDSGSQADLVSSTIVDQLRLNKCALTKPLQLQMAMSGSRGMLHYNVCARLKYQTVNELRKFDVGNLDNYDMILGTPFLFQHSVRLSFNPNSVYIGSDVALPMDGVNVLLISSLSADIIESNMEDLRNMLRNEAIALCKKASETELPPFRAINHIIPLIEPDKVYNFIPSRCAEALKPQFKEKSSAYLKTGRWQLATGTNAVPMLFIPKKTKDGTVQLRTVLDKRQQNANTRKLASPLPNTEEILSTVSRHKYRTLLDGKDAYEQIRVVPEDVPKTLFHTPLGTMVSLVMQQGDCNAGATYQGQMNHMFAKHIGVFMFVYLDDIIIFSDSIEDHVKHIRIVFDILRREKFYLSPSKMQFFAHVLSILGHIIDEKGIKMDPNKVDSVSKWKTPTNKEQLASYLGALRYLAPNCAGIRIPMAVLTKRASGTGAFRWEGTEERAFRETQRIVEEYRDRHRVALRYDKSALPVYLITDASLTGASGFVSQGDDWQKAPVAAFWSGKFNTAQQNYSVTDREALAIISSLQKFQHMLHGSKFEILTDHRALEYLMTQKNLSARQARWLDTLSQFDFTIRYIEGTSNVLADALSRIYSDEPKGTVRAKSEYVQEEQSDGGEESGDEDTTRPLLAELAATVATESGLTSEGVRRNPTRSRAAPQRYDPEIPGIITNGSKTKRAGKRKEKPINNQIGGESMARTIGWGEMGHVERTQAQSGSDILDSPAGVEPEGVRAPDESQERETDPSDQSDPRNLTKLVTEIDIIDAIRSGYDNDTQFGKIVKNVEQFTDYELRNGLLYMSEHGRSYLCVPDAKVGEYKVRPLLIAHAHSMLSHLGNRKTYAYMRESLWWKNMTKDIESFCNACTLCASSKTPTQAPYGLLKPLPVPQYPWSQIGIDFMGPLPESKTLLGKFDMICVVIDHLTLMVHIIPTKQDYTAKDIAEVLYTNVYRLHGVPDVIVSDRDKLFTSQYHRELHDLIGTELKFSSAYHPQTDGMTERANRTVMSLVRTCVNPTQRDWATKLPAIEFAINSARSETTGFSPFALNYGRLPRPMLVRVNTDLHGVQETARSLKYTLSAAHDAIIAARPAQTVLANKRRRLAPFKLGDLVYVSTKNMSIPEGKARKLAPKFIGPYRIEEVVKEGATYRVELPHEMRKRGIRATFHASLLKPHIPSEDRQFPGRNYQQVISLEGDEDDWAVDKIANHRGKGNNAVFEIIWQSGDRTWEPWRVVKHLEALRQYYEALGIDKASDLPWKGTTREADEESDDNASEILQGSSARVLIPQKAHPTPQLEHHSVKELDALALLYIFLTKCLTTRATAWSTTTSTTRHMRRSTPTPQDNVDTRPLDAGTITLRDIVNVHTPLSVTATVTTTRTTTARIHPFVDPIEAVAAVVPARRPGCDYSYSTPRPKVTERGPPTTSASNNCDLPKPSMLAAPTEVVELGLALATGAPVTGTTRMTGTSLLVRAGSANDGYMRRKLTQTKKDHEPLHHPRCPLAFENEFIAQRRARNPMHQVPMPPPNAGAPRNAPAPVAQDVHPEPALEPQVAIITEAVRRAQELSDQVTEARTAVDSIIGKARSLRDRMNAAFDRIESEEANLLGMMARMAIGGGLRQALNATDTTRTVGASTEMMENALTVSSGYDGEVQPRYKDVIVGIRRLATEAEGLLAVDRQWAEPLRSRCRALLNRLRTYETYQIQALSEQTPNRPDLLLAPLPNTEFTRITIEAMREMEVVVRQLAEVQDTEPIETTPSSPSSSSPILSTTEEASTSRWPNEAEGTNTRNRAVSLLRTLNYENLATKDSQNLGRSNKGKNKESEMERED